MNKQMIVYSQYASKAIAAGRKRHMRFRAVNQGEVPSEPFYEDGWWYEILESESTIPPQGRERIEILKKAGIPIKGMVVAHEAPKLLSAPQEAEKEQPSRNVSRDLLPVIRGVVEVLGIILAVIGVVFLAALRVDPALIVVLDDGTWLEIMTWYD